MSYVTLTVSESNEPTLSVISGVDVPTLEVLQGVVGGYIESLFTIPSPEKGRELTAYVNEEGHCIGLPIHTLLEGRSDYKLFPIAGNVVITALGAGGETLALNDTEVAFIIARYRTVAAETSEGVKVFGVFNARW